MSPTQAGGAVDLNVIHPSPLDSVAAAHETIAALRRRSLFFVGGMPKSGTTWLCLLLDAHPMISCRGEGHFLTSLAPRLRTALAEHSNYVKHKSATIFAGLDNYPSFRDTHLQYLLGAAMSLLMVQTAGDAPIVGEKTPDNVLAFNELGLLFPDARFLNLVRDGRDCAVSAWFHNLRLNPDRTKEAFPDFAAFAGTFAKLWTASIDAGSGFANLNPGRCLTIRYENLKRAPEIELARVLVFLGADADPDAVRRCVDAASFERLSGGRAPGEEDLGSFFRIGVAGDWRRHFTQDALAAFEAGGGLALRRCGYVTDEPRLAAGAGGEEMAQSESAPLR